MRRFIIEADGGSRGNPGPAAYGAVVIDAVSGVLLAELADYVGETTNNVAEYSGLVAGLHECAHIDPSASIEVRMDSKLVVEQMSGRWQVKNANMKDLVKAAHAAFDQTHVTYEWIPREKNTTADRLVNMSLDDVRAGGSGRILVRPQSDPAPAPTTPKLGWAGNLGISTTTLICRHGVTEYTAEKRFSGSGGADLPLTDLGQAQAKALAAELIARGGADIVVTSPLLRTRQTAGFVADALGCPLEIHGGIAEASYGEWDGCTYAEINERWPEQLRAWLSSADVAPPGGETFNEVRSRVEEARRDIIARHHGLRVAVISHVTPTKILVGRALEAPLQSVFRMELSPCSISTSSWFADGHASLLGFAEATHTRHLG